MEDRIHILLFYKFQLIEDPEWFVRKHKRFCEELRLMGKVLVAREGVNGSISGSKEQVEKYKKFLNGFPGFSDVVFKEEIGTSHPFKKMIVRVRKEIVSLHKDVDMVRKGKYVSPKEFLNDVEDEDVIILDARNDYEYKLGRFKQAINPNIKTFRQFPDFVEKFGEDNENKKKKIVMYCTGGIRCEKASAYMEDQGFENVCQLEGGIINFCQQFPNTAWEGKCFVFDKRLMSDINQNNNAISGCVSCGCKSDLQRNCKYVECDELVVQCVKCQEKLHKCCSKECMYKFLRYARERAVKKKDGTWKAVEVVQEYGV